METEAAMVERRRTRYDYAEPGSFARVQEAALALADADTDEDYERARKRLANASRAWALWRRRRRAGT